MLDNDGSQDDMLSSFSSFTQRQTTESLSGAEPSFLAPRNLLHEQAGQLSLSFSASIAQLTQLWMNERNAPELLSYERYLVEPLIEAIEVQVRKANTDLIYMYNSFSFFFSGRIYYGTS